MRGSKMVLSKLLKKIAEEPDRMDDGFYCELVEAAWRDFRDLFFLFYSSSPDNFLYGWKGDVEGTWRNTISLLTPVGSEIWGDDYRKHRVAWAELAEGVALVEKRVLAQVELDAHERLLADLELTKRLEKRIEYRRLVEQKHGV